MKVRARRGWFVAIVGGIFSAGGACSKAQPAAGEGSDAAALTPGDGAVDGSIGITLDALPTVFREAGTGPDSGEDVFAPPSDAATCTKTAPGDPCGLDPQCGCSATQTCDFTGETLSCVVAGSASLGHGCAATASCAPELTCFNGACRPYCSSTGDAGCEAKLVEGGSCVQIVGADGGPIAGYDVCTFNCQLQDPNACGQNGSLAAGCIFDGVSSTDCEDVGLSGVGTACQFVNDCLPGLVCAGTCLPWCRIGRSPSDCGDGEACQAFAGGAVTANGIEYGYCP